MIVIIDASVLAAYLLEENGKDKIAELLIEGVWATELVITESCNAVLTALKRGRLGDEEADEIIQVLSSFIGSNIKIYPQKDLVRKAFVIARDNGVAMYDAVYIALAKQLGGSLASRDPKQIETAKKSGVNIIHV